MRVVQAFHKPLDDEVNVKAFGGYITFEKVLRMLEGGEVPVFQ